MAVFKYLAIDEQRAAVRGVITADSPRQARDLLRSRGWSVRQVWQRGERSGSLWARLLSSPAARQWSTAVHELAMLLRAGIPMLEALDTISQQHHGRFRTALLSVRDKVAAGAGLAEALRERPDVFDSLSTHLVEVGENAGTLEQVLDQLAGYYQRLSQLKDRVMTALAYPTFLVVFAVAATVFLMTFVLPPLLDNLQEQLAALPWPTRVVRWCSDALLNYGWLIALAAALIVAAVLALVQNRRVKCILHAALLRLPLVGPMLLKQNMARIAMVLAVLSRSGIVLTRAFQLAAGSTNNLVLRGALVEASERMGAGRDVAAALAETGVFPPLAVRIFSVGQETGRLEEMLDQLSADYDRQVATASARLTALLEPVLIVLLAVLVGFVLFATILPILEAGNVLQ